MSASPSSGHFIWMEIKVVGCVTAAGEVFRRVRPEAIALVKGDRRSQDGGGLQHDPPEAELASSRDRVTEQQATHPAASRLGGQIHLAKLTGCVGDAAKTHRADDAPGVIQQNVERSAGRK